jgi:hypothetical protein
MDRPVDVSHFSGPLHPHGDGAFTVAVGGIAVRFEGLSEQIKTAALERYGPFLSEGPPIHTVAVFEGPPDYLDMAEDKFLRLEEREFPEGRILVSHVFAALRPPADGKGFLRVSSEQTLQNAIGAVENYLRWVVADLALDRGGFVLHAAGLAKDGKAYLLFGHSGAGKSTATEISLREMAGVLPLSDDLVLILKQGERFVAATTPFWGSLPQQVKERGLYPLAGAYRLRQSPSVQVREIPLALAAGMILSCCPFVADPARRADTLAPLVEAFCRRVPVKELLFRKDPSFWEAITPEEVPA